ncbi:MAG: HAMP domain-containing histidine kinase [Bacteroidetes bacterium]|nr:HAMP domain-containing histidine kinase [Bacteroidota bacterium]
MLTSKTLRVVSLVSGIALGGLVLIQVFWVQKAYRFTNEQFQNRVTLSLISVASQVYRYNSDTTSVREAVTPLGDEDFLVSLNGTVPPDFLLNLLVAEFRKQSILQDFQVGMYDCFADSMVWRTYNTKLGPLFSGKSPGEAVLKKLPSYTFSGDSHMMVVHFPGKRTFIARELRVLSASTLGVMVIMGVFIFVVVIVFREKRLSAMRQDFINNMTHEFKTPISTLLVAAEALKKNASGLEGDRVKRYAQIIQDESLRLKTHVEQILKVAMVESARNNVERQEINARDLLQSVKEQFKTRLENKQATFEFCSDLPTELTLQGDKNHLSNALFNLLDNALKYGGEQVHIRLRAELKSGQLVVEVSDNGPGIPKAVQGMIFEKFYRVSTGNRHDIKGFGLGLSYVKQIVRLHGGQITLRSKEGAGAVFTLKLKPNLS